jgi:2-keto-4-pentenoate hydratase/2-oxohepta-3-ene-1,7-dioic acid hydratase in catechol pathway
MLLADGVRVDASGAFDDFDEAFFSGDGLERLAGWAKSEARSAPAVPPGARLGPPVARPSKIVCIGLNYRDHAEETGAALPSEPIIFCKSTTALCGCADPLVIPRESTCTDYEVELAVVIGKRTSYVTDGDALSHIAGYVMMNDYSERSFQKDRGGQWVKGKSCDSFAPLGPFLATADEVPNPGALGVWLDVNGEPRQRSSTSNLIFPVPFLVGYLSQFMTLLPGDIISTGTPAGVGMGFDPPRYLNPGDVIEFGIDGLGSTRQTAVAWRA